MYAPGHVATKKLQDRCKGRAFDKAWGPCKDISLTLSPLTARRHQSDQVTGSANVPDSWQQEHCERELGANYWKHIQDAD